MHSDALSCKTKSVFVQFKGIQTKLYQLDFNISLIFMTNKKKLWVQDTF